MGKTEFIIIIILFNLFLLLFIIAIVIFIKQYRFKRNQHLIKLNNQEQEHLKEILRNSLEIKTQTMQHIGREIHDNVGQKLTLASLYAQQLVLETNNPQTIHSISQVNDIINQSLFELRQLSKSLVDDFIDNHSLLELIKVECQKVTNLKRCTIDFIFNNCEINLDYQQKSILLRICQEFIQNSLKYANCNLITLVLHIDTKNISFKLSDDGSGFNVSQINKGIGLKNVNKRVLLLNGSINITSTPAQGTHFDVNIPIN